MCCSNFQIEAAEAVAKYDKQVWFDYITQYDYESFKDPETKRRFQLLSVLGKAALPEDRFSVVRFRLKFDWFFGGDGVSNLDKFHNTGDFCRSYWSSGITINSLWKHFSLSYQTCGIFDSDGIVVLIQNTNKWSITSFLQWCHN